MSATRPPGLGTTKTCPHCKRTILVSSAVCPGCKHHLRFIPGGQAVPAPARTALRVEGVIASPTGSAYCEYTVVVAIRNERGEEVARHVVNVGSLSPGEIRTCVVSVDVVSPTGLGAGPLRRDS